MFIPLHDDTALRIIRFQLVNGALIAVNVVVLLYSHLVLAAPGKPSSSSRPGSFRRCFITGRRCRPALT